MTPKSGTGTAVPAVAGPDILAANYGSLITLSAVTPEGREWLDASVDPEAQRWCGAVVVEPRYLMPIVDGARAAGLSIAPAGEV